MDMSQEEVLKNLIEAERNFMWFNNNLKHLLKEYDEQFVAVEKEKIVAHGDDLNEVSKELRDKGFNPSQVFIQFVSKIKSIL